MLGKCFCIIVAISLLSGAITGNLPLLANAALDGAARAVEVVLSLMGMTALWCGIMRVLEDIGVVRFLSRLLAPLLRLVFPGAWKSGVGREEITASVSANLLGIGNAATPFALKAMEKMEAENPHPGVATDDMVTLAVLGAASPSLLPTTMIVLRRAAGSLSPYKIILPVWICSLLTAFFSVLLSHLWSRTGKAR